MSRYFFSILGAVIVGVGVAWLLTTSVTLAYRRATAQLTVNPELFKPKMALAVPEATRPEIALGQKVTKVSPIISARAYLVADLKTGERLASREPEALYPIASITKLMTALVALESINQKSQKSLVTVNRAALATSGDAGGLVAGEKLMVADLLYPLLLESSNDAAEVIARHFGRDRFIDLMNRQVTALGLTQTAFVDPTGLDPGNRSSASDLFRFLNYLFREERSLVTLTKLPQKRSGKHLWLNKNHLSGVAGYLGGKSGQTVAAGETLVALFDLPRPDGSRRPVGVVLLQSDDREQDARAFLNYLNPDSSPES